MADVRPFRGIRYAGSASLDDLVAPPYDVLSAEQTDRLRTRSPFNAVHVDLPVGPGEPPHEAAYRGAADTFATWRRQGILQREVEPAVYLVDRPTWVRMGASGPGVVSSPGCARRSVDVLSWRTEDARRPQGGQVGTYRAARADLSQIFPLPGRRRPRGGRARCGRGGARGRPGERGARRRWQYPQDRPRVRREGRAHRRLALRSDALHRRRASPVRDGARLS